MTQIVASGPDGPRHCACLDERTADQQLQHARDRLAALDRERAET
jgi:hypothetical protein